MLLIDTRVVQLPLAKDAVRVSIWMVMKRETDEVSSLALFCQVVELLHEEFLL